MHTRIMTAKEQAELRASWGRKYRESGARNGLGYAMDAGWTRDEWIAMGARFPEPSESRRQKPNNTLPEDDDPWWLRELESLTEGDPDQAELIDLATEYIEQNGGTNPGYALLTARWRLNARRMQERDGAA